MSVDDCFLDPGGRRRWPARPPRRGDRRRGYQQLLPPSEPASIFSTTCRVVSPDTLIKLKRAAGRPSDLLAIAELELLRDGP